MGSRKNPVWRVVVADQRWPRDGRIIESIGHYNAQTHPSTIVIDRERLDHWLERGAEPTDTVRKLMRAPAQVPAAEARTADISSAESDAPAGGEAAEAKAAGDAPVDPEAAAAPTADAAGDDAPAAEGEGEPEPG